MKDRPNIVRLALIGLSIIFAGTIIFYQTQKTAGQDLTALENLGADDDVNVALLATPTPTPPLFPGIRLLKTASFQDESAPAEIILVRVDLHYVGPLAVQFSTKDGTAIGGESCGPGIDYIKHENVTLIMEFQYTQINVPIQICSDNVAEAPETVTIVLSGQNARPPTEATLTISDQPLRFTVSGRVLSSTGQPIRNAEVVLSWWRSTRTGSFGWYSFEDVVPGEAYYMSVSSGRHTFTPPAFWLPILIGDISNVDFVADEPVQ